MKLRKATQSRRESLKTGVVNWSIPLMGEAKELVCLANRTGPESSWEMR